jgi:hypothetical protein
MRRASGRGTRMSALFVGMIVSAVGVGYIMYGRRQTRFVPVIAGVVLCIYPYFVDDWVWLAVIGVPLLVAPFLIDF